jgi:hypothetical protein
MRGWDMPTGEIVDDRGEIVELAPATPQKDSADDNSREKWRPPGEMLRNPLRPTNQPINQCLHASFLRLVE